MGENILVVENEPNIQEALALVFEDSFKLSMAASAEEALATSPEAAEDVGVIFLDGDLGPGLSGDEALPFFRQRFPLASIVYIGALEKANVPCKLLIYKVGGHAFGLHSNLDVRVWPVQAADWLRRAVALQSTMRIGPRLWSYRT